MSDRYDALRSLLAMPDAVDLPPRGRRYTCAGDPLRRDGLKRHFERAYLRYRIAAAGKDESEIVSVRRSPMRLVRRRA